MNRTILARSAAVPGARRQDDPMPTGPGRSRRGERGRPARRGPASAVCRLLGRLLGADPDPQACWCVRCTLHRLGIWRREHIRIGSGAWVRTTVFGIRIRPDRYAFPLNEHR